MTRFRKLFAALIVVAGLAVLVAAPRILRAQGGASEKISALDLDRAETMAKQIFSDIRKNYYDPNYHGINLDQQLNKLKEDMRSSPNFNIAVLHLAASLDQFNDSHLYVVMPPRPYRLDYGFRIRIYADVPYIIAVRPGSDAEAKGLKPGDRVIGWNGFEVTRETLLKLKYRFNSLSPVMGSDLIVQSPGEAPRRLRIAAMTKELRQTRQINDSDAFWQIVHEDEAQMRYYDTECYDFDKVEACKLPAFDLSLAQVDSILGKARSRDAFILDLRGNGGGSVDMLEYLLGGLFDHDVKTDDRHSRKNVKPEIAKHHGASFTGKLVVLIDSDSASASEIFSKVIQQEKRGTVVGDRSAGAVMEAEEMPYTSGTEERYTFFGASITIADLIMGDGKSLEKTGVTPDVVVLPTAEDLRDARDPVLAKAFELAGAKMSPEQAGKLFQQRWPKM